MSDASEMQESRIPPEQTYAEAVETFLEHAAPWLTPLDAVAVATLRHCADELDMGAPAAVLNQLALGYRNLLKRKPVEAKVETIDPVDALLIEARHQ